MEPEQWVQHQGVNIILTFSARLFSYQHEDEFLGVANAYLDKMVAVLLPASGATHAAKVWHEAREAAYQFISSDSLNSCQTDSPEILAKALLRHKGDAHITQSKACLLYTSPSPRDISGSRMPSSA